MPRIRSLCLLSVALACAPLSAQEPAPKPAEPVPAVTPEKAQEKEPEKTPEKTSSKRHFHHYRHHSKFGAYAKNYIFSLDHLFKLNRGQTHAYVVAGLGGARWNLEPTTKEVRKSLWTTKLAITGGLGMRLGDRVNIEARYVVSSVENTYDGNTVQASLGWHF